MPTFPFPPIPSQSLLRPEYFMPRSVIGPILLPSYLCRQEGMVGAVQSWLGNNLYQDPSTPYTLLGYKIFPAGPRKGQGGIRDPSSPNNPFPPQGPILKNRRVRGPWAKDAVIKFKVYAFRSQPVFPHGPRIVGDVKGGGLMPTFPFPEYISPTELTRTHPRTTHTYTRLHEREPAQSHWPAGQAWVWVCVSVVGALRIRDLSASVSCRPTTFRSGAGTPR